MRYAGGHPPALWAGLPWNFPQEPCKVHRATVYFPMVGLL